MCKISVGDIVFSYASSHIKAYGRVLEACQELKKPEFKDNTNTWDSSKPGWQVKIKWTEILVPFRPKTHIKIISPLLPEKYSPMAKNGNGLQGCYLAKIDKALAEVLLHLAGISIQDVLKST